MLGIRVKILTPFKAVPICTCVKNTPKNSSRSLTFVLREQKSNTPRNFCGGGEIDNVPVVKVAEDYKPGTGDKARTRGLHTHTLGTALHPTLPLLDHSDPTTAGSTEQCT